MPAEAGTVVKEPVGAAPKASGPSLPDYAAAPFCALSVLCGELCAKLSALLVEAKKACGGLNDAQESAML